MINFSQGLNLAVRKGHKVYIYGMKNNVSELIYDALNIYDIKISGYVYDVRDEENDIQSIYEVAYKGTEDKFIVIAELEYLPTVRARETLECAGFSLEQWNYTGIQKYTYASRYIPSNSPYQLDSLLGWNMEYSEGLPGWKRYGKDEANKVRIIILGGSTSSEVFHPENWISKLYYKMLKENIKTTIYNGAHPCNDIVSELLRILRDGHILHPDIVISMSGVNNLYYKKLENQFNEEGLANIVKCMSDNIEKKCYSGAYDKDDLYSFWYRNEKLLELVSEFYGAKFFCFLQPMNITMKSMNLQEKSIFERQERIDGANSFTSHSDNEVGYINIMRIFEHQDDMFFDNCHYTDNAHEIIADKVFETIVPTIKSMS
jgi:hypothetical protein